MAEAAGFHAERGNTLLDDGAALTGEVGTPILGREAKLAGAGRSRRASEASISPKRLAVGDGANDLAMIQRAGLGVAYHAKPVVAEAAGAAINHNDLTALLYLQGYTRQRDRQHRREMREGCALPAAMPAARNPSPRLMAFQ